MKKARIVLTAVGILAIVGGALAFKSSNRALLQIYTPGVNSWCTVPVVTSYTTNFDERTSNSTYIISATFVSQQATCGLKTFYPGE